MRVLIIILISISLFTQSGCNALKYKKVDAKEFPPDPKLRIKKNMEEGRGFRIMDTVKNKGGTSYEFASSNPLWKATLDTLDFMPLVSANYSGGIVITDWYSENSSPDESIKITVRFLTNEIRSDSLDIDVFIKQCKTNSTNCVIKKQNNEFVSSLAKGILKKAALYENQRIKNYKKENPYEVSTPDNKRKKIDYSFK